MSCLKTLDLPIVPILSTDYLLENDIEALIAKATIKSTICAEAWAEGIVIRPLEEKREMILSDSSGRLTFKAINPEFLLKYGE